jgi:two-component system OmpR family response regulator
MRAMRILVVEDDRHAAEFLLKGLREAGHTVDHVANGQDGMFLATTEHYDVIVLDRMLPKVDGLTIVRTMRASKITTPVLVLSALGDVDDRIDGLRAGGDDYLVKPFAVGELLARLDALQRRAQPAATQSETVLRVADLEMNLLKRTVKRDGRVIDLKPKEFLLLEYLMRHVDQVVTRTMLLEGIWNYDFDPKTNVIDVHISNLRGKIDKGAMTQLIHTVRGAGYLLGAEVP